MDLQKDESCMPLLIMFLQLQLNSSSNFYIVSHKLVACAFGEPNETLLLGYQIVICCSGVEGTVIPRKLRLIEDLAMKAYCRAVLLNL
jgi:hypothetical protein